MPFSGTTGGERAILVGLDLKAPSRRSRAAGAGVTPFSAEESIEELQTLASSAGASVAETILQARAAPDAATLIGKVTKKQVREIAELKMPDLNAANIDSAMSMIAGTARSMGITVED